MKYIQIPVLHRLRSNTLFIRGSAFATAFFFIFFSYSPYVLAIANGSNSKDSELNRYTETNSLKLDENTEGLKISIEQLIRYVKSKKKNENLLVDTEIESLRNAVLDHWGLVRTAVLKEFNRYDSAVSSFSFVESESAKKKLRESLIERRSLATHELDKMALLVNSIIHASNYEQLEAASYMAYKNVFAMVEKSATPIYNNDQMPFGTSSDVIRSPFTSEEELHKYLGLVYEPGFDHENAAVHVDDTKANEDVQITDAIINLANSLQNDPVKIHNWVCNNIAFIPSFGSIQGSAETLLSKQGNAFDIASLHIALLRASNIPARYAYGSVIIPGEVVENWVGGVQDRQSAFVILAQGGIPTSAISNGGQYENARIEHVWVEAWGNFNIEGTMKWNSMDSSFKQYNYSPPVDPESDIGLDSVELGSLLESSVTYNEGEGSILYADSQNLLKKLDEYKTSALNVLQESYRDANVGDIFGKREIIKRSSEVIPDRLPYLSFVRTKSIATLPDSLRHFFKIELFSSSSQKLIDFEMQTAQLVGKKLSISFIPATDTDKTILTNLQKSVSNITEPLGELSAGFVKMIAQITVDGEPVEISSGLDFGDVLTSKKGFVSPRSGYLNTVSTVTVGDFQAIGLNLQGISSERAKLVEEELRTLKDAISNEQGGQYTAHEYINALFHGGLVGYYGTNDRFINMIGGSMNLVNYRMPSFGTISLRNNTNFILGQPVSVRPAGMGMDMEWLMTNSEGRYNCWQDWVAFNLIQGRTASHLEHAIIDNMYVGDEANRTGSISTVRAMDIANKQGQKIYVINENNVDSVLPLVTANSFVKNDIRISVDGGNAAIIHEQPVSLGDYYGSGYILLDPDSGTGAYRISTGENGAVYGSVAGFVSVLALAGTANTIVWIITSFGAAGSLALIPPILIMGTLVMTAVFWSVNNEEALDCYMLGLTLGSAGFALSTSIINTAGKAVVFGVDGMLLWYNDSWEKCFDLSVFTDQEN